MARRRGAAESEVHSLGGNATLRRPADNGVHIAIIAVRGYGRERDRKAAVRPSRPGGPEIADNGLIAQLASLHFLRRALKGAQPSAPKSPARETLQKIVGEPP